MYSGYYTRGIVSLNRFEGGRFECKDSHGATGDSQRTIESVQAIFQKQARVMDMKSGELIKEFPDLVAQLGEQISRVEHVQEDGSGSVRATANSDQTTGDEGGIGALRTSAVPAMGCTRGSHQHPAQGVEC